KLTAALAPCAAALTLATELYKHGKYARPKLGRATAAFPAHGDVPMPEYVTLGRRFRVLGHRAASEWVGRVIASRHAFYLCVEAWPSWWADDWDSGATADVWNGMAGDAIKRPGTPLSRLGEVAGHPDWPLRGVTNDSV